MLFLNVVSISSDSYFIEQYKQGRADNFGGRGAKFSVKSPSPIVKVLAFK